MVQATGTRYTCYGSTKKIRAGRARKLKWLKKKGIEDIPSDVVPSLGCRAGLATLISLGDGSLCSR